MRRHRSIVGMALVVGLWVGCSRSAIAQPALGLASPEDQRVDQARQVLDEIMALPTQAIPRAMLHQAQGVAIVPNVVKGSFVVGVRHGRGVLLVRDTRGGWTLQHITLTGGSVGWQAGVQSTDVVLVFKSPRSIQGLMQGKLTIGADVAAAAGPVGRNASIATDPQLQAEVYSYSRSRGLFAGVAIDGTSLQVDPVATAAYYQRAPAPTAAATPQVPTSAMRLIQQIAAYSGDIAMPQAPPQAGMDPSLESPATIRQNLVDSAERLQTILDPQWQAYLALPPWVKTATTAPIGPPLDTIQQRYDAVRADPRYVEVSARHEFQATYYWLGRYQALAQTTAAAPLQLPPPPAAAAGQMLPQ